MPPSTHYISANTMAMGRNVGSGGGLSAWSGGAGASGGVAGGTTAGGGVKRVVPGGLVSAVGSLLDDQGESIARIVKDGSDAVQYILILNSSYPLVVTGNEKPCQIQTIPLPLAVSTPTRNCSLGVITSRLCSMEGSERLRESSKM